MRRWNGWGDEGTMYPLRESARLWLHQRVGEPTRPPDTPLSQLIQQIPDSPLRPHPLLTFDPQERLRHARGQSFPDWVALRCGRVPTFPAAIAYPENETHLQTLIHYAQANGAVLIPYGGGTSVVGGINPETDGPAALTVDLSRLNQLLQLNKTAQLATFGAGISGPDLEAQLNPHGYTLGHFPQSFELSTLGGWIATRSSGQQSLYYGRIEDTFAGGRLVTPTGVLEMPPFPASAAGPDLRHLVLGSEGRLGIISQATVRITPLPEAESFLGIFFPTWEQGVAAVKGLAQAQIPLSMLRLSNPLETEANLIMGARAGQVRWLNQGLNWLGQRPQEKCLLLMGVTGDAAAHNHTRRAALNFTRQHGGVSLGQLLGHAWQKGRFLTPYLRNTLWELGYGVDTLESAFTWDQVIPAEAAIVGAIHQAAVAYGERVLVIAHLSHVYPTGSSLYVTYLYRLLPDPEQLLAFWGAMKAAASQAIITHKGTITHQHGIGTDHAPYLQAEKGELGLDLLNPLFHHADPNGVMNPRKLLLPKENKI